MKPIAAITQEIHSAIPATNLEQTIAKGGLSLDATQWLRAEPGSGLDYYRALAAAGRLLACRHAIEVGACRGLSALALAEGAEHVTTYDIVLDYLEPACIYAPQIRKRLLQQPQDALQIDFSSADLVFIDIDHQGDMELAIHERLLAQFNGIGFYDDIFLNAAMAKFWFSIRQPREATNWHFSGFGVVDYRH